jgi:hypothetical protein
MKQITLIISVLFLLASDVSGKCYRRHDFYVGAASYWSDNSSFVFNLDTAIDFSGEFSMNVRYEYSEQGKTCYNTPTAYQWKKNNVIVSTSQIYTITDTGFYEARLTMMDGGDKFAYLHVGSSEVTSVNEITQASTHFSFTPSSSTGIFKIETARPLSKVFISDNLGRVVFTSSENISSVDLSAVRNGVYFYYAEDKEGAVFRGRVVKQ